MLDRFYQSIGNRLKRARESCGFTQSQVAGYLGVKREQVSYYENGVREIDLVTLSRMADLYGYRLEHFMAEERETEGQPEVSPAFRAAGLEEEDLAAIARAKRFVSNLHWLNGLLAGGERSAAKGQGNQGGGGNKPGISPGCLEIAPILQALARAGR